MTDPNERAKVLFRVIEQTSDGKTRDDIIEDNILRPYWEVIMDTIDRINDTLEGGTVKNSDVHHEISDRNRKRLTTPDNIDGNLDGEIVTIEALHFLHFLEKNKSELR